jgi:hypothetical protein
MLGLALVDGDDIMVGLALVDVDGIVGLALAGAGVRS